MMNHRVRWIPLPRSVPVLVGQLTIVFALACGNSEGRRELGACPVGGATDRPADSPCRGDAGGATSAGDAGVGGALPAESGLPEAPTDEPDANRGNSIFPDGMDKTQFALEWADEFAGPAGARPAAHWFFFDGWETGTWRDAVYTEEDAFLDGSGRLVLRARVEDGKLHTSYLQTYDWPAPSSAWTTFGPGPGGRFFEARIDVNGMNAGGLWCGFWLFDPTGTYDGNPETGTEIDIFEHIIAYGKAGSWTAKLQGGNSLEYLNVANHWGLNGQQSSQKFVYAPDYGVHLRNQRSHSVGLLWAKDHLGFYLDGKKIFETTEGVSTSDGHAIMLSMEYDEGPGDAWGLNENVIDYASWLPNEFIVDWVRVYRVLP